MVPTMTKMLNGTMIRKRSEEHTSELQSQSNLVCRLLLEKKNALRDSGPLSPAPCSRRASGNQQRVPPGDGRRARGLSAWERDEFISLGSPRPVARRRTARTHPGDE